mmetsp:Transcript_108973/g.232865  ORF Transcript_108973/g.232865 Transcript_108973/m.232865 type:complete len:219 (-) Transcript_108973:1470-2126(-)
MIQDACSCFSSICWNKPKASVCVAKALSNLPFSKYIRAKWLKATPKRNLLSDLEAMATASLAVFCAFLLASRILFSTPLTSCFLAEPRASSSLRYFLMCTSQRVFNAMASEIQWSAFLHSERASVSSVSAASGSEFARRTCACMCKAAACPFWWSKVRNISKASSHVEMAVSKASFARCISAILRQHAAEPFGSSHSWNMACADCACSTASGMSSLKA